jgi:hypothetical protein
MITQQHNHVRLEIGNGSCYLPTSVCSIREIDHRTADSSRWNIISDLVTGKHVRIFERAGEAECIGPQLHLNIIGLLCLLIVSSIHLHRQPNQPGIGIVFWKQEFATDEIAEVVEDAVNCLTQASKIRA